MESTGSTNLKPNENSIPKENYRFIPSITEQGLSEDKNKKKKL